jgi:hypothetical protein
MAGARRTRPRAGLVEPEYGKDFRMASLRTTVIVMALGAGVSGCSFAHWSPFHCDSCDDFPAPTYGPGNSMMPGTYTGPPPRDTGDAGPMTEGVPGSAGAPAAGGAPAASTPAPTQPEGPAPTPPAVPGPGADAAAPARDATASRS